MSKQSPNEEKDETVFDKNTQLYLILALVIVIFAIIITLVIS